MNYEEYEQAEVKKYYIKTEEKKDINFYTKFMQENNISKNAEIREGGGHGEIWIEIWENKKIHRLFFN